MKLTRLSNWLIYLGGDAVGRFALQIGSTIIFARLLLEEDFGRSALTIAWVQVLAILVCAPFEEGLVQRRIVRKGHFNACLAASLALACLLIFSLSVGIFLTPLSRGDLASVSVPIAAFSLILLAEGPVAIFTAAARRARRFRTIATGNFLGLATGTMVGLWLATQGAGLWSLLAVRLVARFVLGGWLVATSRIRFWPQWSVERLKELSHFAGWHTSDRGLTVLSDALFQSLVTALLGAGANGYLNMATRIIEPIRGITGSASHNISMSLFSRLQDSSRELKAVMSRAVSQTALFLVPVFFGLAATSDSLITLLAGPDWAPAVSIAVLFGIATAIQSPFEFVHTASAARGRPELGFYTSLLNLAVLVLSFWWFSWMGIIAIGFARLFYYLADALCALLIARGLFRASSIGLLFSLAPALICGAVMGGVTWSLPQWLPTGVPIAGVLVLQVICGIAVYTATILLFARAQVAATLRALVSER